MKTIKLTLLLTYLGFIAFFFSSCTTAKMMTFHSSPLANAPLNEETKRGGTVAYNAQALVQQRRANAYLQMHNACGGNYLILREYNSSEQSGSTNLYNGAYYADTYITHYIDFACE